MQACIAFDISSLRKLGETINSNVRHDKPTSLNAQIDWQESQRERRIVIRYGVDAELDAVRRQFESLPSMLARVADSLLGTLPEDFTTSLHLVYFPQIGFLCATPAAEMGDDVLERAPEDWTFHVRRRVHDRADDAVSHRRGVLLEVAGDARAR